MTRQIAARTIALTVMLSLIRPALGAETESKEPLRRLLYVTVPDGSGGKNGTKDHQGILIYDIDDGHKFVRKIDLPSVRMTRGVCANAATDRIYISHSNGAVLCMDLKTDEKLWHIPYVEMGGGCDRLVMTPDGKKLYVPSGYWSEDEHMKVVDAITGKLLKMIVVSPEGGCHDALCSIDGRRVYCGSTQYNTLTVIDTEKDEIIQRIGPFKGPIFPFTVNGAQTLCYVNTSRELVGFEIGDIRTGEKLHQVCVKSQIGQERRCHGIGLTPDEKEVWLIDQDKMKLYVFDNTVMPPKEMQSIDVALTSHGWITFSIDGQYAWPDTGDVIDAKTKEIVATLKDADGKRIVSSKFVEVQFRGDDPVRIGHQLGVGRVVPSR